MFSHIFGRITSCGGNKYSVYNEAMGLGVEFVYNGPGNAVCDDNVHHVFLWPHYSESNGCVHHGFLRVQERVEAEAIYNAAPSGIGPGKVSGVVQRVGSAAHVASLLPKALAEQVKGLGPKGATEIIAAAKKVAGVGADNNSVAQQAVAGLRLLGVPVDPVKLDKALAGKSDVEAVIAAYLASLA